MNNTFFTRLFGGLVYLIPLKYGMGFGLDLFFKFQFLEILRIITLPIEFIKGNLPFGYIFLFLFLFLGIVKNPKASYFLRFNTLQAILINIILLITSYLFLIISRIIENISILQVLSECIFIILLTITIFCIIKCFLGKEPDIPWISNSVRGQI